MNSRTVRTRYVPLAAVVLALACFTPAVAGHGKSHGHGKPSKTHHAHRSHYRGQGHAHSHNRHFDIPGRIARHRVPHYRSYYHGSAYYSPHRHRHSVYYFPVRVGAGYAPRPHYYCGDDLFRGELSLHGEHVSIALRF